MFKRHKARLLAIVSACAVSIAFAAPAQAQSDSLVNVAIGDVTVQVPLAVAANLCDINVNVLANQVRKGDTKCTATADSMASAGDGHGNEHGDGKHGDGHSTAGSLVNVVVGNVTLQLPVGLAANLCDVNVNVLANQVREGDTKCTATADSAASAGNGAADVPAGGNAEPDGLVDVQVGDVHLQVPIAIAANICDVNVNVLAIQERDGKTTCTATAKSVASSQSGDEDGGDVADGSLGSLVSVKIGDIVVQLPLALAANACDINVNVLANQVRKGDTECTAKSSAEAKKDEEDEKDKHKKNKKD